MTIGLTSYLTNTLDMEDLQQTEIPGLESLSDESHLAGKIKQKEPILVILGKPAVFGELSKLTMRGLKNY